MACTHRTHNSVCRKRNAFEITESELKAMADGNYWAEEQAEHRIKDPRCNRHTNTIVHKGEEEILSDVPHRRLAQPVGPDDPRKSPFTSVTPAFSIATSVPVPMAIPTSAWARAGSIVDAIPGHRHDLTFLLKLLDDPTPCRLA
ncbi:MAG: hypothetical protein QM771_00975 [Nitrospira sp.]